MMKIEMHAHTSEVSPCALVPAEEMMEIYSRAGYDAVVVTNHYNNYVLEGFGIADENERVKRYLLGFDRAKTAGERLGIKAILGVEVCLCNQGPEDYLLYGVTQEVLYQNPYLYNYSLQELRKVCDENEILLFQAHPCRGYLHKADPALLDGAEAFNGHPGYLESNLNAAKWVKDSRLIASSGSDFHRKQDRILGGVETNRQVYNARELREMLLSGDYTLITPS